MKKSIIILVFLALTLPALSQQVSQSDSLASDIKILKENLARYCSQRQTGLVLALGGGSVALVSHLAISNSPQARKAAVIAGCVAGIGGLFITIDADKWIRKASLGISPGKITLNF